MRARALTLLLILAYGPAAAAAPADLSGLEEAWHGCLREAYAGQADVPSRQTRERNALGACKAHEDAYVFALMAARADRSERHVLAWAQTWATSITAYLLDPVSAWIASLKR